MTTSVDDYSVYLQSIFDLVATMTIKSSDTAKLMNDYISLEYGNDHIDEFDPTTWKYYKNIAGEYHDTDTVMTVTSLDTLESIEFTKENLLIHTSTRDAYEYGTRYYNTLVSLYPNQELLILGILYPANIDEAIEASDGTILAYRSTLVESQETTLIQELSEWLQRFHVRWYVRAFGLSDELYPAVYYASMVMNIVPKVLNLRLKRCKTYEAHTFHIRQYLASHGRLDRFMDYMTIGQVLFLYRNINYIEHHVGHVDTFNWLVEKLLSPRYIPIANYTMKHLNNFSEETYFTNYTFKKTPLNTQYNVPEKDYFDLEELLQKENDLAPWNSRITDSDIAEMDYMFKQSPSAIVQTKDLESTMVDYTDAVPHPVATVVMNHWAYLSMKGLYSAVVVFNDPIVNETHTLSAQDAYIYMTYLSLKSGGLVLKNVPDSFYTEYVRRISNSVEDLISVADYTYYGNTVLQNYQRERDISLLQDLIVRHPVIWNTPIKSTSTFFKLCSAIYNRTMAEWYIISTQENQYRRGMLENMIRRQYADVLAEPTSKGQLFENWLKERNIVDFDLTLKQTQNYIKHIFTKATGYYVDPRKIMANIQKAMIGTLTQLSSYSIQIIASINEQPITLLNSPTIRVGRVDTALNYGAFLSTQTNIVNYSAVQFNEQKAPINVVVVDQGGDSYQSISDSISIGCNVDLIPPPISTSFEMSVNTDVIHISYTGQDPDAYYNQFAIGYESVLSLSQQELSLIKDIWTTYGNE